MESRLSMMTRTSATLLLGLALGLALGVSASAENVVIAQATMTRDGTPPSFETLDKNHDGKISLNEAADDDDVFVAFKDLDKDKDGMLTREEFVAYNNRK